MIRKNHQGGHCQNTSFDYADIEMHKIYFQHLVFFLLNHLKPNLISPKEVFTHLPS